MSKMIKSVLDEIALAIIVILALSIMLTVILHVLFYYPIIGFLIFIVLPVLWLIYRAWIYIKETS